MSASRNTWITAAVLLVILLCAGCATPQAKPRLSLDAQAEALSGFSLGLMAEHSGDLEAALQYFKQAIQIDPAEKVLYPPAVSVALQLGHTDEALRLARQLRKHNPEALLSILLEAQICALTEQVDKAEVLFRKAAAEFPNNAKSAIALARFSISQENNPQAIKILEAAQTIHPEHADILYMLGTLYVNSAREMENEADMKNVILDGIAFLEKALELEPKNPLQWQQLGFAYLAVKDTEKAQAVFEKAYELSPGDINTARHLLDICILNNSIGRALTLCEELPRYTGTEPEMWLQYLSESIPKEDHGKLAAHMETYLKEHPRAPVLYYTRLGSFYLEQQNMEEAETVLNKAQELYPTDNRVRTVIGYLHLEQERYEDAYNTFNQVRDSSEDSDWISTPFFTFNFMVAAQKTDRTEEAAQVMADSYTKDPAIMTQYMHALLTGETSISTQSAINLLNLFQTLSPDAPETLYYLTLLQADQEQYEEALVSAQQFEERAVSGISTNLLNGFFYYQYGILHERTGQLNEAETLFRKSMDLGDATTAASARNYIAYMWAERGEKLEMGLKLIQEALQADPDNAAFLDTLGWIYYMMGRYDEALNPLKRASELMSEDPVIWEHLGDTYMQLGDLQAAKENWEKGLEVAPEEERLIQRLEENNLNPDNSPAPEDSPADTPSHP